MSEGRTRLRRIGAAFRTLQTLWTLLGVVLVLLLGFELGLRAAFGVKDRLNPLEVPDRRVIVEGYGGAEWPVVHYRELERLRQEWEPFVYFRQRGFQGETINVAPDGQRKTWRPPASEAKRPRLLLLGGSALWGYGSRDDQTIPSHLVRLLHEKGRDVDVRNLAEIGHVGTQELITLIRELQAGYRPDLVVFYDGVNDTTSALLEGRAGVSTNEGNRRREFNLRQSPGRLAGAFVGGLLKDSASLRLARSLRRKLTGAPETAYPSPGETDLAGLAAGVVNTYKANRRLVETLGNEYKFRSVFFWQPVVFDKKRQTPFEEQEHRRYSWAEPIFREVNRCLADASDADVHNLAQLFAEESGLIFIDYCHTTEDGNRRIAEAMAGAVLPLLP